MEWPDRWGTGLSLDTECEEEFVEKLSLFVARARGIEQATQRMREQHLQPLGGVECEFTEKGFTLRWMNQRDMKTYVWEFDDQGKAMGGMIVESDEP